MKTYSLLEVLQRCMLHMYAVTSVYPFSLFLNMMYNVKSVAFLCDYVLTLPQNNLADCRKTLTLGHPIIIVVSTYGSPIFKG